MLTMQTVAALRQVSRGVLDGRCLATSISTSSSIFSSATSGSNRGIAHGVGGISSSPFSKRLTNRRISPCQPFSTSRHVYSVNDGKSDKGKTTIHLGAAPSSSSNSAPSDQSSPSQHPIRAPVTPEQSDISQIEPMPTATNNASSESSAPSDQSSASKHPIEAPATSEQSEVSQIEPIPTTTTDATPSSQKQSTSADQSPSNKQSPNASMTTHECPDPKAHELPSSTESRRSHINKRFSHLMDHLQGNILLGAQRINDLTGYSGIEALKQQIITLEDALTTAQEDVRKSRLHYKETIANRAASQREVNSLLSRKETWMPNDVERFTSLYRSDHGNELAVQEAATKLSDAERSAEKAASTLSASILSRYHEEQIWSDKIRRMSTWGTWGLMGVNVLLFLVFQFGFEPWRRARLVRGFEEKVREALEKEKVVASQSIVGPALVSSEPQAIEAQVADTTPIAAAVEAALDELDVENEMSQAVQVEEKESVTTPIIDDTIDTESVGSEEQTTLAIASTLPEAEPLAHPSSEEQLPTPSEEELLSPPTNLQTFDWKNPQHWHDRLTTTLVTFRSALEDLFSARLVTRTQHDITIIALNSAATGAATLGLIVMLIFGLPERR